MNRALLVSFVLLAACPSAPAPSMWNGLWLSPTGEGVFVYSGRDAGVEFSPRRLNSLEGRLVLTQRCTDFEIASQGEVRLIEGKRSGGSVTERADGFDLSFASQPALAAIAAALTRTEAPLDFRLEGFVTNEEFTLRDVWFDGGFEARTERQFTVSKRAACPNDP